jgi:hypothetical protein
MKRALISATVLSATVLSAAMLTAAQAQTIGTATTDLNIRSGPDPQCPVIGMLRENRRATVFGCIEGSRWCQIDLRGQRGWAYSQYMVMTGDAVAVLQAPEFEVEPRVTIAAAPQPLPPAPFAPLAVPIPVPVPVPVPAWQPAPAVTYQAPAPVYAATTPPPPVYRAPAPAPVVTYRAPTTVLETTAVAPREFVGRLTAPREVVYAATTPPRAYVPPRSVRTYISMNPLDTVWLEGSLLVGAGIPDEIDTVPVPGSRYNYAYVNDYPVLVDPASRRVVYVYR